MSTLRSQLRAQLVRFDEDAFIALANRGLLRRAQKDLEKQNVVTVDQSADTLTLALGEYHIRFDIRGPAHAHCSCPALGVCQHILAAAISLTHRSVADKPHAVDEAMEADLLPPLHAELLQFDASSLVRHAGKTGYRWACQFILDLDPESGVEIGGDRHILIRFAHPRMSFRYMGGGVVSLVADVSISQIEKYQVAAVLAYQRAHGVDITPLAPSSEAQSDSLDLGTDHAVLKSAANDQHDSRARLRNSVKQVLEECIMLGLSHLSRGIHERYSTLAVWAQGAEYHRLALILRRLADHVELLLERAGSADEHRLLDEMTIAYGLISALDNASSRKTESTYLVGKARTQYEKANKLELLGLGASAWRSASGYVGLTMVFWSPKGQEFMSCTDARPASQAGFNPVFRYKAPGPWSGLGAPTQATGCRVFLSDAQVNANGRISAAESVSAKIQIVETSTTFAMQLNPFKNWSELAKSRTTNRRSLLSESQPMKDWAVLFPKRFGSPKFDENRQTLVWPLFDEQDQRLDAELEYSEQTSHAIARIERLQQDQLPTGTMLVALIRNGGVGLIANPLSLVKMDCAQNENPIDALHFDRAPEQSLASRMRVRFGNIKKGKTTVVPNLIQTSALPQTLLDLRNSLQRHAERGVEADSDEKALALISVFTSKAKSSGFTAFSRLPENDCGAAALLLQVNYIVMQYERLIVNNFDHH